MSSVKYALKAGKKYVYNLPYISFDRLIAVLLLVGVIGGVSTAVQRYNRIAANNILNEKLKANEEKLASLGKLIDNSSVHPVAKKQIIMISE